MLVDERRRLERKIADMKLLIGDAQCELSEVMGHTPNPEKARDILEDALDRCDHFFDGLT